MYVILSSENKVVDMGQEILYTVIQDNGVAILSDSVEGDAILVQDSQNTWLTQRSGYETEWYRAVEVSDVPDEVVVGYYYYEDDVFYTTQEDMTALAESKSASVASLVFVQMAESEVFDDVTLTEHMEQFAQWGNGIAYLIGGISQYNGKLYRCLQAHTSQEDWTPDGSASLWKSIGDPTAEYPDWSQPIGAVDAYELGAQVTHKDTKWENTVENNVWEPGVYGWEEVK